MKNNNKKDEKILKKHNVDMVQFGGTLRLSDQYGQIIHEQPMQSLLRNYMVGMNHYLFNDTNLLLGQKNTSGSSITGDDITMRLASGEADCGIVLGDGAVEDFDMYVLPPTTKPEVLNADGTLYVDYKEEGEGQGKFKQLSFLKRFTVSQKSSTQFQDIGLQSKDVLDKNIVLLSHDKLHSKFQLFTDRALDISVMLISNGDQIHKNLFMALRAAHMAQGVPAGEFGFIKIDGTETAAIGDTSIMADEDDKTYGLVVGSSNEPKTHSLYAKLDNLVHGEMRTSTGSYGDGGLLRFQRQFSHPDTTGSDITIKQIALYARSSSDTIMYYRATPLNPIKIPANSSAVIGLNFLFKFGEEPSGTGGIGQVPVDPGTGTQIPGK